MSKFTLVTLCLVLAVMIAFTTAADLKINSAKFVADKIVKGQTAIMQISFTGVNSNNLASFSIKAATIDPPVNPAPKQWKFASSDGSYLGQVDGYAPGVCWDETTKQAVFNINMNSAISFHNPTKFWNYATKQVDDATTLTWTVNCPVTVDTTDVPTNFDISASMGAITTTVSLALPTKGFVSPNVDLKTASISQAKDDPLGTSVVSIEFTTDTSGHYTFFLENGPLPDSSNQNDGKFADFYCTSGTNKEFARIQYPQIYTSNSSEDYPLSIYIPEPTKASIKCTFLFNSQGGDYAFVASERISAKLSIALVTVSRGLHLDLAPAGGIASLAGATHDQLSLTVKSTPLQFSATPVNVNSTIVFKFSKHIDAGMIQLNEDDSSSTSYRANTNCQNFRATSFVDAKANTITLKDIDQVVSSLSCTFAFKGSEVFLYQDSADMASVTVSTDKKELTSIQVSGNALPIYFETVGKLSAQDHVETSDDKTITSIDTFSFTDNYSTTHTYMRNPVLFISFESHSTYNYENFASQLVGCEATSPSSSTFEKLSLKYDSKTLSWSVPLDKLAKTDSYSVLIKCTRTVNKITKFGLDITPSSPITLSIVNLLDNKRYFSSSNDAPSPLNKRVQTEKQTGNFPGPIEEIRAVTSQWSSVDRKAETVKAVSDSAVTQMNTQITAANTGFTFTNAYTAASAWGDQMNVYTDVNQSIFDFAYFTKNIQDLKSYFFTTLNLFYNIYDNRFHEYYESIGKTSVQVSTWITVKPATAGQASNWNFPLDQQRALEKPAITAKYPSDTFLYSYDVNNESESTYASPFDGCGYVAGFLVPSPDGYSDAASIGYDYKTATFTDDVARMSAFVNAALPNGQPSQPFLCMNNSDKCTMNADCQTGACIGGVCLNYGEYKTYAPEYVRVSSGQSKGGIKAFYSSATMASVSLAAVVVVAAAFIF